MYFSELKGSAKNYGRICVRFKGAEHSSLYFDCMWGLGFVEGSSGEEDDRMGLIVSFSCDRPLHYLPASAAKSSGEIARFCTFPFGTVCSKPGSRWKAAVLASQSRPVAN